MGDDLAHGESYGVETLRKGVNEKYDLLVAQKSVKNSKVTILAHEESNAEAANVLLHFNQSEIVTDPFQQDAAENAGSDFGEVRYREIKHETLRLLAMKRTACRTDPLTTN